MKPNFALSLSFDGLRLMHRVEGGWHLVGQVALDTPDLADALARLRTAAVDLDAEPMATKLLIPNDQIRYLALDTTRAQEDDVVAALDGATPYPVSDLVYDYAKGGGRTYVAAVARETLDEARAFASEHGFNPVSFAAVPEPFTYVGEAFFGATEGGTAERDTDAVVVIGQSAVPIQEPEVKPEPGPEPEQIPAEPDIQNPAESPDSVEEFEKPTEPVDAAPEIEVADPNPTPDEVPVIDADETDTDAADFAEHPVPPLAQDDQPLDPSEPEHVVPEISEPDIAVPSAGHETNDAAPDLDMAAPVETPTEETPPMFASLRADRNEGRPSATAVETTTSDENVEPSFGRRTPPALSVPTGQGTDPMPPVVAPSREDTGATPASVNAPTAPIPDDVPDPDIAPPITGEASTALSPEAAVSATSLTADPEDTDETPKTSGQSATATAIGAATAVTGAVGGMFASRRMARAEAREKTATESAVAQKPDEKSKLTVFGARKKPKPKPVVGGKPRFLGLILTAILLLFLLAIAAFAALSDDTIARWLGFDRGEETQIAAPDTPVVAPTPVAVAAAPDALAAPTTPTGAQILTPEEAQRIYAATGVWQRAPRIPQNPRTTSLDGLQLASAVAPVMRVPASPLASASSVAGDSVIATPVDPPPPSATFNYGTDGLVVATPEGAPTPDGVLIIAGPPPLNPPTRPGTVAPEITPQAQLVAVIPEQATPVPDAPAGVIVISGSPSITPPVRTGTVAPITALETPYVESVDERLVATDGLVVLAGAPPVLPPVRPGTSAPSAALLEPTPTTEAPSDTENTTGEGLNVIAGAPSVLPPARPGTTAPSSAPTQDTNLDALSADIATALGTTTAQAPTPATARPLIRPATVTLAAAEIANAPTLGALTAAQAAAFRPQTRPAGLAPAPVETPTPPEPIEVAAQPAAPVGLQIAPEIAAAVEAAANRPNPIVNPTAQAVAQSERPDTRPRNMERIVARAQAAQERAATQVAAVAPRTVAPSGPTAGSVAQNATLENAINLRNVNLIGIYGGSGDRRALVRLGSGRFLRLTVGDRLDGGRVTAISADALSYTKSGRAITLEVPG